MEQQGSWDSRQECVYAWTDHLQSNIEIQSLGQTSNYIYRFKGHFEIPCKTLKMVNSGAFHLDKNIPQKISQKYKNISNKQTKSYFYVFLFPLQISNNLFNLNTYFI